MLERWRQWRRSRRLARYAVDATLWRRVLEAFPMFARLSPAERARLYELTVLFLAEKRFFGTHGLQVEDFMRVSVAARACLLVLGIGLEFYRGWRTVILYPGGFVAEREVEDEFGVVHTGVEALDGESMYRGAVALNWEEAAPTAPGADRESEGLDVVLHELAHKLDELSGDANGMPPLHGDMPVREWSEAFLAAYETFVGWVEAGVEPPFDDYASTDPAEFFAVATETFFLSPRILLEALPDVYRQLARFYRQDPAAARAAA